MVWYSNGGLETELKKNHLWFKMSGFRMGPPSYVTPIEYQTLSVKHSVFSIWMHGIRMMTAHYSVSGICNVRLPSIRQ